MILKIKYIVNPLVPETEEEKIKFSHGEINKTRRLERRKSSLNNQAPTPDERLIIHDLFMKKDITNYIPMANTHHETLLLCQPTVNNFFFIFFYFFLFFFCCKFIIFYYF